VSVAGHSHDHRAISVPLAPVNEGLSRSLAGRPRRRSGQVTGVNGTNSQADSAGSIPVTRSHAKAQVGEGVSSLGLARWRSSWDRRAISGPLAHRSHGACWSVSIIAGRVPVGAEQRV
jgi:hypothetical protein